MIGSPGLPQDLERLTELAGQVRLSTQFVLGQLASWNGYFVLKLSKMRGIIPEWAERYIELTKTFQSAIYQFKNKHDVPLSEHVAVIYSDCKSAVGKLAQRLDPEQFFEAVSPKGHFVGQNRLLRADQDCPPVAKHKTYWYQNLGLLMNVYKRTEDPAVKRLTSFLAFNFLAKAAPICPGDVSLDRATINKIYDVFQLSLAEPGISYNRENAIFDSYFREGIKSELAAGSGNLFFLTDTKCIEELLPLWFFTVAAPGPAEKQAVFEALVHGISKKLRQHMEENPASFLDAFFDRPLLVDLTSILENDIHTFGDADRNAAFADKLRDIEILLEQAIEQAVDPLCGSKEMRQKLKALTIANMTCVCRSDVRGVGVVKVLPVLCDASRLICEEGECRLLGEKQQSPLRLARILLDIKSTKSKIELENFLNTTGVRLGSVRGRMKAFDFLTLEDFLRESQGFTVEYANEGDNCVYYRHKLDLANTSVFKRFESLFHPANEDAALLLQSKPYLNVLGKSTILLLKGLLSEISEERWAETIEHPELRQIVQTTLAKINVHLAMAEMHKRDFTQFTQWIELIHYEMAALLTIFSPFTPEEFPAIYRGHILGNVPEELQGFVKAGLTKSGMNTFAGLSAALNRLSDHPVRVIDEGSHFEIVEFVGENHAYHRVMQDERIKKADLYLAEFNHNVRLYGDHDTYRPGNVIQEVSALLDAKSQTERLTVAVDCTIDFVSSPKVHELLTRFSKEIAAGRLNFVFFRSGQKFDMFGMDHFYGSPWYMVNNGAKEWDAFNLLSTSEALRVDPLSAGWFCLANKYAPESLDDYRKAIFENTKEVLRNAPEVLLPGGNPKIKLCRVEGGMEPCYLDIKCYGDSPERTVHRLEKLVYKLFTERGLKIHTRGGYGYFNPNVVLFLTGLDKEKDIHYATMRLHPGINPEENEVLIEFLREAAKMAEEE